MHAKEVKFKIEDLEAMTRKLIDIGVRAFSNNKELDFYYDDSARSLQREDKVLRLRQMDDKTLFCFQSPRLGSEWNERDTIETEVHFGNVNFILTQLGFKARNIVEKIRRKYYFQGLYIYMDNVPFLGYFLELHGHENKIKDMMNRLRLVEKDIIKQNYTELFQDHLKENNVPVENPNELTFSNETRHVKTKI